MPDSIHDDPQWDGTDMAHPAWWRGYDDGVQGAIACIREMLDGRDGKRGVFSNAELNRIRHDIRALRAAADRARMLEDVLAAARAWPRLARMSRSRGMIWQGCKKSPGVYKQARVIACGHLRPEPRWSS